MLLVRNKQGFMNWEAASNYGDKRHILLLVRAIAFPLPTLESTNSRKETRKASPQHQQHTTVLQDQDHHQNVAVFGYTRLHVWSYLCLLLRSADILYSKLIIINYQNFPSKRQKHFITQFIFPIKGSLGQLKKKSSLECSEYKQIRAQACCRQGTGGQNDQGGNKSVGWCVGIIYKFCTRQFSGYYSITCKLLG